MKWFAGLGLKTQGKDLRAAHGIIGELVLSQNDFMKDSWSSEHGRSTLTIFVPVTKWFMSKPRGTWNV
jgi:hypothetical protein